MFFFISIIDCVQYGVTNKTHKYERKVNKRFKSNFGRAFDHENQNKHGVSVLDPTINTKYCP